MCPKDTDRPENEVWRNFKGEIRLFWTKFSYCIFVQSSSTGLYEVPMAIILQPINIRKCNINTLTTHFLATQGKSINRELIFLQILSPSFSGANGHTAYCACMTPSSNPSHSLLSIKIKIT